MDLLRQSDARGGAAAIVAVILGGFAFAPMDGNGHEKPINESDVQRAIALLANSDRAEDPRTFPTDGAAADQPGLYAWWADRSARDLLGQVGGEEAPRLIYVGQAGATLWPSGKRSTATLKSRVRGNHITGTPESSTFRKTISAILLGPLSLRLQGPGKLAPEDNRRVSEWIGEHLRVTIVPWDDRDSLERLEEAVIETLDPPLNLDGRPATALRQHVKTQRKIIENGTHATKRRNET